MRLILLTLVVALQASGEEVSPFVRAVELHLPPSTDPRGLAGLVAVRQGQPLSARAVRRTLERLYSTGRFADIVVRAESLAESSGVRVVFEATPKKFVRVIRITGNQRLSAQEILVASKMVRNTEYYPEKLQKAVDGIRSAYRRRGYQNCRVSVETRNVVDGIDVTFLIEQGTPVHIGSITVAGSPGLPLQRLLSALTLQIGDIFDGDRLERGIESLKLIYRSEKFFRARVETPVVSFSGGEVSIGLPIFAGPRYVFHFRGNANFPDRILNAVIHFDSSDFLDRSAIDRMRRRVEAFYRYRGYHEVAVRAREIFDPPSANAVLLFEVEEGDLIAVDHLAFDGNVSLSDQVLRSVLAAQIEGNDTDPLPNPHPESVLVEEAYTDAASSMVELYKQKGFLNATVEIAQLDIDVVRHVAEVHFTIKEGPQTFVGRVLRSKVGPTLSLPPPTLTRGQPLNPSVVEQERAEILRKLGRQGYLFAQVGAETSISLEGRMAEVFFKIEPGPQVKVGKIILEGLRRTQESVARAHLKIRSGDVLDPDALFESQRSLVLMGIFNQVTVRLISPDTVESAKDVIVEVKERSRLSGDVAGGYFLVEGPRILGDGEYSNFLGLGINLSARGKLHYAGISAEALSGIVSPSEFQGVNGLGGRANLSAHLPQIHNLMPAQVGVHLDLVGERVLRRFYRFTRFAAIVGADWTARRWLNFSLQYELEHDQVRAPPSLEQLLPSLTREDQERLRFPTGIFSLHTLKPTATLDFRDDPVNPRRGLLISGTSELTHDLGAYETDFNLTTRSQVIIYTFKISGLMTAYFPVGAHSVLAISVRGGKIIRLNPNSITIPPKRFFLGGSTSMRGFQEDGLIPEDTRQGLKQGVQQCGALANPAGCSTAAQALLRGGQVPSEGGELFTLAKAELRLPAFSPFDWGLFLEVGNLWLDQSLYRPFALRYVAGAGLRYATPIGPIAIDLGFNVLPDSTLHEPLANVNFNIGLF